MDAHAVQSRLIMTLLQQRAATLSRQLRGFASATIPDLLWVSCNAFKNAEPTLDQVTGLIDP